MHRTKIIQHKTYFLVGPFVFKQVVLQISLFTLCLNYSEFTMPYHPFKHTDQEAILNLSESFHNNSVCFNAQLA